MSIHDPMDKAYLLLLEDSSSNPIDDILSFGEQGMELILPRLKVKVLVNRATHGGSLVKWRKFG